MLLYLIQCEHDMQKIENVVSSHIDTDVDVHRYILVVHSIYKHIPYMYFYVCPP